MPIMAIGLTPEDADALAKTPGVTVPEYMAGGIIEMRLNTTKKPLDDPRGSPGAQLLI